MADAAQLPLRGVIMCCTSIPPEQRSDFASIADTMGAIHKFDLTSDVTHLIVGDTDTPKYKFVARERPDVKCLLPSWIEAVRQSWLKGDETDVEALESRYKLPTFHSLRVSVTGFEDLAYRKEIEDQIDNNGGEYRGNLTKDVTHLIAKVPSGQKHSYAGQWGIKIVSVEWLEQSLERGMILDENLYSLQLPSKERGSGAWIRKNTSTTSLGKRARETDLGPQTSRKLRRTASAKLNSHNVGLWSNIVGGDIKSEERELDEWEEQRRDSKAKDQAAGGEWAVESKTAVNRSKINQVAFTRHQSETCLGSLLGKGSQSERLFHGKVFVLRGFDDDRKIMILEEHLRSHGAEFVSEVTQLPPPPITVCSPGGYIIIPHNKSALEIFGTLYDTLLPVAVTELWVERCLMQKQLEQPGARASNVPFRSFPLAGFENLTICSTAFQDIDIPQMSRIAKLMGAIYNEEFSSRASVLVCNSLVPGHEKLKHAKWWHVPAVTASWFWDCIQEGKFLSFESYLVQPTIALETAYALSNPSKDIAGTNSPRADRRDSSLNAKRGTAEEVVKKTLSPEDQYPRMEKSTPFNRPSRITDTSFPDDKGPSEISCDSKGKTDRGPLHINETAREGFSSIAYEAPIAAPLQEISLNSSPLKSVPSPAKKYQQLPSPQTTSSAPMPKPNLVSAVSKTGENEEIDSLGPAISSLLARHHRSSATAEQPKASSKEDQPYRRRRRQLLGRATSNVSSYSINLSRASSVDTMNTDGLGTPIENAHSKTGSGQRNLMGGAFGVVYDAERERDPDEVEPPLQMTQLGYEDPDVAAWRERVTVKMGGGVVKGGSNGAGRGARAEWDEGGIAKRTRLALGGR